MTGADEEEKSEKVQVEVAANVNTRSCALLALRARPPDLMVSCRPDLML